jgi:hypothetical protein
MAFQNPDHGDRFQVVRSFDPPDIHGLPAELSDEVRRAPLPIGIVSAEKHVSAQSRLKLGTKEERVTNGVEDLNDLRFGQDPLMVSPAELPNPPTSLGGIPCEKSSGFVTSQTSFPSKCRGPAISMRRPAQRRQRDEFAKISCLLETARFALRIRAFRPL